MEIADDIRLSSGVGPVPLEKGRGRRACKNSSGSFDNDAELVVSYLPLVKRIAHHLLLRMPPSVRIDDLIQSGCVGLLDAFRKFKPEEGASFETYAGIRIRGEILDNVRKGDWAPRSVHRKSRKLSEASKIIENRTGREPEPREIAEELGISLDEYYLILQDATGARLWSLEDLLENDDSPLEFSAKESPGPRDNLQRVDFKEHLRVAIDKLPEREKLVLALYYDEELNLKEVGKVLEVSESRVSQIRSQAIGRLRVSLQDWI